METLGQRLRSARKTNNLTQSELAKKSGVSQQLISQIENENIKSTNDIFSLAGTLNVSAKWLATGQGDKFVTSLSDNKEEAKFLELLRKLTVVQRSDLMISIEQTHIKNEQIINELSGRYSS